MDLSHAGDGVICLVGMVGLCLYIRGQLSGWQQMHNFINVDSVRAIPPSDRYLGASMSNESQADAVKAGCGGGWTVYLALFVFAIIAAVSSNNEEVNLACGDGIRKIVIAHIVLYVFIVFVVTFISKCAMVGVEEKNPICMGAAVVCSFVVFISWCVMAGYAYSLSQDALAKEECVEALKQNSAGIKSAMLAFIGYTYFALDVLLLVVVFLIACCIGVFQLCLMCGKYGDKHDDKKGKKTRAGT